MNIEYEATFTGIDKDDVRRRLEKAGAKMLKKEFLQKRAVFKLPKGNDINGGWLRVRDEGGRITMSLKIVDGDKISDQKEIEIVVDDFKEARRFLAGIGAREKAFQESKRELWELDGVEITIDEWPFLEPFVEVEGKSEEEVRRVSKKIGFNYAKAKFSATDVLYSEKYDISVDRINNHTPRILFKMDNPFI